MISRSLCIAISFSWQQACTAPLGNVASRDTCFSCSVPCWPCSRHIQLLQCLPYYPPRIAGELRDECRSGNAHEGRTPDLYMIESRQCRNVTPRRLPLIFSIPPLDDLQHLDQSFRSPYAAYMLVLVCLRKTLRRTKVCDSLGICGG